MKSNRAALLIDERCLQPDLVGADRIVPIANVVASRDLDASSSTQRLGAWRVRRARFSEESEREIVEGYLRWGLIPHHAYSRPEIQPVNARAESIAEKPMFKDAYRKR